MPLRARRTVVTLADRPVGVQSCPAPPPRRAAVRRAARPARGMSGFWPRQVGVLRIYDYEDRILRGSVLCQKLRSHHLRRFVLSSKNPTLRRRTLYLRRNHPSSKNPISSKTFSLLRSSEPKIEEPSRIFGLSCRKINISSIFIRRSSESKIEELHLRSSAPKLGWKMGRKMEERGVRLLRRLEGGASKSGGSSSIFRFRRTNSFPSSIFGAGRRNNHRIFHLLGRTKTKNLVFFFVFLLPTPNLAWSPGGSIFRPIF